MALPPVVDGEPTEGMTPLFSLGPRSKQDPEAFRVAASLYAHQKNIPEVRLQRRKDGTLVAWGKYPARAEDHMPVAFLNRTGEGMRTLNGCSCGWKAKKASPRMSTMFNAHMAHLRSVGAPPRDDYSIEVYGEGPAKGLTWNQWYASHPGEDPFGERPKA
jgi:hypothetical protein